MRGAPTQTDWSSVGHLTGELLGGHVPGRAEHLARRREPLLAIGLDEPRETEVEETHASGAVDHQVRGLQIAVDDPCVVERGQREGGFAKPAHALVERR